MSTAVAAERLPEPALAPDTAPAGRGRERHLEIVATRAQRRARPKLVYAIVAVSAIGAVLLGQLLISIFISDGAYDIVHLTQQQTAYQRQQAALNEQLEVAASTQNLVNKAESLGMVSGGSPLFINLSTGAVSGAPSSAQRSLLGSAGNMVANSLLPDATLAQQQAAAAQAAAQQVAEQQAAQAAAQLATDDQSGIVTAQSPASSASTPTATASPTPGASSTPTPSPSVASNPATLPSPVTR